jgi:ubiquinol-cytochrome c reductase cytochrome b subunit
VSAPPGDFAVSAEKATWTGKLRETTLEAFPPDRLLPDRQPAYVSSWAYVFGALSIGAFAVVLLSGGVLAVEGPAWWHGSSVGLFVNSVHLWSTEFFFMFMVVHLWAKFFMAAWRGRRKATWITGVLAFVMSIATAFTGYLSQQNFDSEWISTQAKDGINATGAGAFWNVLNFGQMLMWHIVLLPLVVVVVIGAHVLLVRRRGVVPPFAPTAAQLAKAGLSTSTPEASPAFSVAVQEPSFAPKVPEATPGPIAQVPQQSIDLDQLLDETPLQEPGPGATTRLAGEPDPGSRESGQPESGQPQSGQRDPSPPEPGPPEPGPNDQLWQLPEDKS